MPALFVQESSLLLHHHAAHTHQPADTVAYHGDEPLDLVGRAAPATGQELVAGYYARVGIPHVDVAPAVAIVGWQVGSEITSK